MSDQFDEDNKFTADTFETLQSDGEPNVKQKTLRKRDVKRASKLAKTSRKPYTPWTLEEKDKFLEGVSLFGKNWRKISSHIGTRDRRQTEGYGNRLRRKMKTQRPAEGSEEAKLIEILEKPY